MSQTEHHISIEQEMRKSYLEYSLSVIIGRAIPDVRDGLKPVHRRILFAQQELGNSYTRPPKKCARIVGDVIGKYHPHGDSAVYDALVRMAQDFSMRDPLEEGQGNFGSIDGDAPAAMRYTEVRMSRLASEFLSDIDKETVDFRPNYDNSLEEPIVLPTKVPNLLLNGSSGIAVGMATNIPPHNLGELCNALLKIIDDPDVPIDNLLNIIHGPDFPTGGFIYVGQGLYDAYTKGRGTVKVRGKVEIEERKKGAQSIVIREIPFGLNKSSLVEKIAILVNERKIDGIADLRDESDRKGIRVVIELKKGVIPEIIINALYKFTPLETSFGINMLAVVDNRPQLLTIKSALTYFLDHRREVIVRRTRFELNKAEARLHILIGLIHALDHIDEVVNLIRSSSTPAEAKIRLIERFSLSEIQAQSILDMRLQRLTGLEREKLEEEMHELQTKIAWYESILGDTKILWGVIRDEVTGIKEMYTTPRRTEVIRETLTNIEIEDLIPDDDVVITLSRRGYIKRTNLAIYQQQRRGGKGVAGLHTSEDDFVQEFITTTNHQFLLLFTNKGRMHQLKVHQVPEGSRTAKGTHIANIVPLEKEEWVTTILTVREFSDNKFFLFATRKGMVKRSSASYYARSRRTGLLAVGLREDDELIMVKEVTNNDFIVLATAEGFAIRFSCEDVRNMGRGAAGVKGIALRPGDSVVACLILQEKQDTPAIMTVSNLGYGKRTSIDLYRVQTRGGKGIINFKVTQKTGLVIGAKPVSDDNALVLLTSTNKIIRMSVDEVRSAGRATMGVRLVKLDDGAYVVGFDTVDGTVDDSCDDATINT
ncbi:DNA gyrase subunit A [Lawsonia intracellularis]|uniref:DNA gyrase subunit A n=1 Tax=Lawsonia intracellularis (strain PHE/MN1-00) TaxID=363253 RepID=GYRA_LAWIP|nr:DNA gyrase subunit A [Lawsonia intracellularis]Q1MQ89.1 RecName: Full=DNA gyrase subunit A [Lawsonia intracellularis PHE/MN1-00]AGC50206.1 DNA gyrase subunit alpha [Lawsonia intracellularis N343]KAA0204633.1 DNA gyrase subunit A [Lawsonia intracellularis]MBZ3892647.1 DNA gyrase subunit A [Lawsonia intracellularis]OMQ03108.1 DNA gyrase subunit A [Lawsonia intracellularis]RBN33186.1 DNA gyrase subunit A [Lawsonia intracellularis]